MNGSQVCKRTWIRLKLRIEEVVIENPLLPGSAHELRSAGARYECEAGAGFQGAEDADESLGELPWSRMRLWAHSSLRELAGAIDVVTTGVLRPVAGYMSDQAVGVLRCHGFHDVGSADLRNAIDKLLGFGRRRQYQMALEDDPVETREYGDN